MTAVRYLTGTAVVATIALGAWAVSMTFSTVSETRQISRSDSGSASRSKVPVPVQRRRSLSGAQLPHAEAPLAAEATQVERASTSNLPSKVATPFEQYTTLVATDFHEQSVDTEARNVEFQIADIMAAFEQQGSRLLETTCHARVCRLEVEHENVQAQDELLNNVPMTGPFANGGLFQPTESDDELRPHTVLYVARDGHALPLGG